MDQKEIEALEARVDREVRDAADQALAAETPDGPSILHECLFAEHRSHVRHFLSRAESQGAAKTMVEMVAATLE